ncbi:unnamed protein product [Thlaspi arvense]|uniref:WD repeat-containing protein 44 n=1 Tax=Thlaspi arvense TaxID=13288 RepID=A0AAU9RUU2_THLAR|nr:unnamed protein product [Thlaspi arvense]
MGTRGDEEDEDCFFDAHAPEEEEEEEVDVSSVSREFGSLHLWTNNPDSVSNRRRKFFQSMGFSFKKAAGDVSLDSDEDELEPPQSQLSSSDSVDGSSGERVEEVDLVLSRNDSSGFDRCSVSSSDDQALLSRNESSSSSSSLPEGLSESGSGRSGSFGDIHSSLSKKGAQSWLKKLGVLTHVLESGDCESVGSPLKRMARVQAYKKQFKELSALCVDQEFAAHDGSILAMRFSPDGKYIATAGEDCVVRVWCTVEEERTDKYEVAEVDSGVYFGMDQQSQIEPLNMMSTEKTEKKMTSFLRKSSDSTCVVLPSKIFGISEKPLHEWRGHTGEILDLSWSEKGYLLSSSVDDTVRLWRVGCDECLKTFSHNNFVTCVAFNPVDDNYFISGSIDGKVRIWDVTRCRVVDYTDIRDIVTAVCYRPDAKGAVIGSITGSCRFYRILENQLKMDREINLHGKKKVPSKRITGLAFFPNDSEKVMVTCADSQIRINASVALPWLRQENRNSLSECITCLEQKLGRVDCCFSPTKGSTTWPEEELEEAATTMSSRGEMLKLVRSAWQPHMWGLVIVTGTWDGRIRVFNNYGLPIRV